MEVTTAVSRLLRELTLRQLRADRRFTALGDQRLDAHTALELFTAAGTALTLDRRKARIVPRHDRHTQLNHPPVA